MPRIRGDECLLVDFDAGYEPVQYPLGSLWEHVTDVAPQNCRPAPEVSDTATVEASPSQATTNTDTYDHDYCTGVPRCWEQYPSDEATLATGPSWTTTASRAKSDGNPELAYLAHRGKRLGARWFHQCKNSGYRPGLPVTS